MKRLYLITLLLVCSGLIILVYTSFNSLEYGICAEASDLPRYGKYASGIKFSAPVSYIYDPYRKSLSAFSFGTRKGYEDFTKSANMDVLYSPDGLGDLWQHVSSPIKPERRGAYVARLGGGELHRRILVIVYQPVGDGDAGVIYVYVL